MSQVSDEVLFNAIQGRVAQLFGEARTIKYLIDDYEIAYAQNHIKYLKEHAQELETLIIEAVERSKANNENKKEKTTL